MPELIQLRLDKAQTLYINGTSGDDVLNVRVVRGGVIGLVPRQGAGLNKQVQAINAAVNSYPALSRIDFTFLDVYDRFAADPAHLLTPSSHFTAKGYRVLASVIQSHVTGRAK